MVESTISDLKSNPSKPAEAKSPSSEDVKDAKPRVKAVKETPSVTSILGKTGGVKGKGKVAAVEEKRGRGRPKKKVVVSKDETRSSSKGPMVTIK